MNSKELKKFLEAQKLQTYYLLNKNETFIFFNGIAKFKMKYNEDNILLAKNLNYTNSAYAGVESVLKHNYIYQFMLHYIRNFCYIHFPRVRILSPTFQQELFSLKKAIIQVTEVDCSPILI